VEISEKSFLSRGVTEGLIPGSDLLIIEGRAPARHVAQSLMLRFEIALMGGSCKNPFPVNGLYFSLI
jgi:hypothetical protein